jgi:hypothetical protein
MTRREALLTLERLFDLVGEIETMDRRPPPPENVEATDRWYVQSARRIMMVALISQQVNGQSPVCGPNVAPAAHQRSDIRLVSAPSILFLVIVLCSFVDVASRIRWCRY